MSDPMTSEAKAVVASVVACCASLVAVTAICMHGWTEQARIKAPAEIAAEVSASLPFWKK